MDTSQDINTVEWFFGYGGNHLGLKRVLPNLRLLAACEIEEFAVENILAKMEAGLLEAAPIWSDCKTFPWEPFVDRTHLFVASYPCQPFSAAGKRQGADDERHLWPYVHRWILRARPLLVFLENVEGHISLGLSTVISDLEEAGYKTAWGIFSASEVGAPHQRKRVFILAYDGHNAGPHFWSRFIDYRRGFQAANIPSQASDQQVWRDGSEGWRQDASGYAGVSGCWSSELADSQRAGLEGQHHRNTSSEQAQDVGADAGTSGECGAWPSRPGEQQHWWEPPRVVGDRRRSGESGGQEIIKPVGLHLDGAPDGLGIAELSGLSHQELAEICQWMHRSDNRTDELRLLGNGVVPATAERAFRVLIEELMT